jgi:hypothetical protein
MLQKLDSEIRECHRHAAECSRSADESRDASTKQDILDMAKRWLCLARSYEFAEQLSDFAEPSRSRKRQTEKQRHLAGDSVGKLKMRQNFSILGQPKRSTSYGGPV